MTNLLGNGNLSVSFGVGATSGVGPVWQTDYTVPSGGQLFAGAGAGAAKYAFFTTNAAQVCNGVGATIAALNGKSMAVNVGSSGLQDIIRWNNIQLNNGQEYRLSVDAAVIYYPFGVGMFIDGAKEMDVPSPPQAGVWFNTSKRFVWDGATGVHTVSLRTNTGVASGNDHCFDNFVLEPFDLLPLDCCTAVPFCYTTLAAPTTVRRGYIDLSQNPPVARDFRTNAILPAGNYIPQPCGG